MKLFGFNDDANNPPGKTRILLAGTSGLAEEYRASICLHPELKYIGCFAPEPPSEERAKILAPYLGQDSDVGEYLEDCRVMLGLGSPFAKARITEKLREMRLQTAFFTLRHPTAQGDWAHIEVGEGTCIQSHTSLTTNITIGCHVLLNLNVTVGHDVDIGDFTTVNPLAAISGDVVIGEKVLVGTGATILERRRVGDGAVVGAGAVVTKDVKPGEVVMGVPARPRPEEKKHGRF